MKSTFDSAATSSHSVATNQDDSTIRPTNSSPYHVLLTGSTGSLGAYLLDSLLSDTRVHKIICLNRTSDAPARQAKNHVSRGLTTSFPSSRVDFLVCDLATSSESDESNLLGLEDPVDPKIYETLFRTTTHVIHNAWPVDFNRHFSTFEPQIQGIRNLITFTRRCEQPVRLFFMSSVSVAGRWGAMPGALAQVPEVVLEDWRLAKMGYGQSKLVAERLIAEATKQYGIDGVICRVAQVGGPVMRGQKGEWNRGEWLPSLITSSVAMGILPETLGPMEMVDWLPVDYVVQISLELLFESSKERDVETNSKSGIFSGLRKSKGKGKMVRVWHVVNPRTTTWSALLPSVLDSLSVKVKPVSFVDWVNELQSQSQAQENKEQNFTGLPAAKLLSFFDDLRDKAVRFPRTPSATLATKETSKHSLTMREVQAVNADWMKLWIEQWNIKEGLDEVRVSYNKA